MAEQGGGERKQLHYFGPLKVNSMQHDHDATAGNKRVTISFEVFLPKTKTGPLVRHSSA